MLLPKPSAIPNAILDIIKTVTDEANRGVKKVNSDQTSTASVKTVLPPNRFEKLPPIIFQNFATTKKLVQIHHK